MTRPTPFFLNMKSTFSNEVFLLIWFANGTETPLPSFRLAPRSANQIGPSNQDFYGRITGAVLMADRTKEEKRQKNTHTHTQRTAKNRWISTKTKTKSNKKKNEQPTETATVPFVFRCVNSLRQQRRRRRIFFYWLARINQISFGKSFELNFTTLDRVLLDLTGFLPNCTRPLNRVKWSKRKLNGTTLLASLSIYLFFFDPLRTIFQTNYWVSNAVTLRSPTRTGFFQTNDVLPSFT